MICGEVHWSSLALGSVDTNSTGACLLYGISRVVIGENNTFLGGEAHLKQRGVKVVNMKNEECQNLMELFVIKDPEVRYSLACKYDRLLIRLGVVCKVNRAF